MHVSRPRRSIYPEVEKLLRERSKNRFYEFKKISMPVNKDKYQLV